MPNLTPTGTAPRARISLSLALGLLCFILPAHAQTNFLPGISRQPQGATIVAGTNFTLAVTATNGPLSFQWRFNGQDLPGATDTTLLLTNCHFADIGTYTVCVSNTYGTTISSNALLNVLPLLITRHPKQTSFFTFTNPTLTVETRSTVPVSYQWLRDQILIPAATDSRLTLTNMERAAGFYCAIASNCFGVVTSMTATVITPARALIWSGTNFQAFGEDVVDGAPNYDCALGLRANGTPLLWTQVPAPNLAAPLGATNVISVAASTTRFSPQVTAFLALRANGTVVAWGTNAGTFTSVPANATNVQAIAVGGLAMALKQDGSVVAWHDSYGVPSLSNLVAIRASYNAAAGITADGAICWLQSPVYAGPPARATNIVDLDVGQNRQIALRSDGFPVVWGDYSALTGVPPATLNDAITVAGGGDEYIASRFMALRKNGNVVCWGDNTPQSPTNPPVPLNDVLMAKCHNAFALIIPRKPFPVSIQTNRICLAGEEVRFSVPTAGVQPLRFQWYFNGQEIADATTETLVLTNAQVEHAGDYAFVATNYAGIASNNIHLSVTPSEPRFLPAIAPLPVPFGSPVRLEPRLLGTPPLVYQWYRDGLLLPGETNAAFTRDSFSPSDMGCYTCVITNSLGSRTWRMLLTDPGRIYDCYSKVTLYPFTNVVAISAPFGLRSDGTVVVWSNYWLDLNYDIPAGLSNVVAISAGEYQRLALKSDGSVVAWGDPAVNYDVLTHVPLNVTNIVAIDAGGNHNMALNREGNVIVWGSGTATNVPAQARNIIAIAAGSSHCLALRNDGTVVAWGQSIFLDLTNIVRINAGGPASYFIGADDRLTTWNSTISPSRYANLDLLDVNDALGLLTDGTLVSWPYPDVLPPPSWLKRASAISGFYALTGAPEVLSHNWARTAVAGQTFHFYADLRAGNAPMLYQWQFQGADLPGGTTSELTLTNLSLAHSGSYSVYVSNFYGFATAQMETLQVSPLLITNQPVNRVVSFGTNYSYTVGVSSSAPLSYQWRFNDADLPGATDSSLVLTNVTLAQAGTYSVLVSNTFGSVMSSNSVLLVIPPTLEFTGNAAAGELSFRWVGQGALESATNLQGPWLQLSNITMPWTNSIATNEDRFFRLRY